MSIVVNGTNLKSTTFNGQSVDSIYYNGSLVWERPPEIQLISGIQSDGKAWIKTDFGTEDFTYTSGSSTKVDGYAEYQFTPLKEFPISNRKYTVFHNNSSNINTRFFGKLNTDNYSTQNPMALRMGFGYASSGVIGVPVYVGYRYKIEFSCKSGSYGYLYYYVYDSKGNVIRHNSFSSDNTADAASPTSDKITLFGGGDEEIRQSVVFHSFTFGGNKSIENERQRILQPAIMKRKGVETVGLYDAKRDIFYGPQEGSFIPHY